jgi:hypothetical protein
MSWASIGEKQTVTFSNLLDAVNTGQLIEKVAFSSSQKCITKSEANTYVYLDTTYPPYASKASNQLVVKEDLVTYSQRIYGINASDQFQPNGGAIVYSDNGGLNWISLVRDGYNPTATSVSRNNTGQYVLYGISGYVSVSNNFGASFTTIDMPGDVFRIGGTAMSNSGDYMFAIGLRSTTVGSSTQDAPAICKSSDYGANWSLVYTYPRTQYQSDFNFNLNRIATSGNGQYILATWPAIRLSNSADVETAFMRSTNYGVSFSSGVYNGVCLTDVAVSDSGQYQLMTRKSAYIAYEAKGGLYWSNNYGAGFALKIYEENLRALYCAMSASGQRMLVAYMDGTNEESARVNKFYFSTDFGATWGSFNTNPTPPLRGPLPGGVYVAPDGNFALIVYVNSSQITYTVDFERWYDIVIPQSFNFRGLNKSR